MANTVCNCIVCAKEFDITEMDKVSEPKVNISTFKICQACLDASDPANDFLEAKRIVDSYLSCSIAKLSFDPKKS